MEERASASPWIDGTFYQFTFNGKSGQPLITSKKEAREKEYELKREIRRDAIDGIRRGVTHDTRLRSCYLGHDGDGRCNARTTFTAQANQLRRGWKYAEKRSGKEGWLVS